MPRGVLAVQSGGCRVCGRPAIVLVQWPDRDVTPAFSERAERAHSALWTPYCDEHRPEVSKLPVSIQPWRPS